MLRANQNSKGIYKQQLMRKEKAPTKEAKERAEEWRYDDDTLRVFVDASELDYQGVFGLGVCFVGQGETIVQSKKHYNISMKTMNVYAEVVAIDYALDLLNKSINNYINLPLRVNIYSDWNEVGNLDSKMKITKSLTVNTVIERIKKKNKHFADSHPEIELDIVYMDKELKRYNPYYRASHNAAKKVIGNNIR